MKRSRSTQSLKAIVGYTLVKITLASSALALLVLVGTQIFMKQSEAKETAHDRFIQIEHLIAKNEENKFELRSGLRNIYLSAAESTALIIAEDKSIIESSESLQNLASLLNLAEIWIIDETGTLIAGTVPDFVGMTLDDGEQMQYFKPMLQDKSLKLVQPIQPRTVDGAMFQYTAVWLPDESYIVEIGRSGTTAASILSQYDLSEIFGLLNIDSSAKLLAINLETGLIDGSNHSKDLGKTAEELGLDPDRIHDGAAFHATVNSLLCHCVFMVINGHYVGRIVPVEEMYFDIIPNAVWTLLVLLACSSLMILSIRKKLNLVVLRELRSINSSLGRITNGTLSEQVDAESCLEFSELSGYLNRMIGSLRERMNERERIFRILSQHSNRALFRYRITDGSITPLNVNAEQENALSPLYHSGYSDEILENSVLVAESSKAVLKGFFHAIHHGESVGEIEVEFCPAEGVQAWHHLKFSSILEGGRPVLTLLSAEDTTERHVREQKLLAQADNDTMTGLLRRGRGEAYIRAALERPHDSPSALIILDLDDLKGINDTYGHSAGDRAIVGIADAIKSHFRKDDILMRVGGDEFIIFCSGGAAEEEALEQSLAALLRRLGSTVIEDAGGRTIHCSVGYAIERLGNDDFDALYHRADVALYQVKRSGKGNFALYTPEMEEDNFSFRTNLLTLPAQSTSYDGELRYLLNSLASFYDLVLSVNLSRNSYYLIEETREGIFRSIPPSGAFTDFYRYSAMPVHPEDLPDFKLYYNRESLLAAHSAGTRSVNRHFRYCIGDTIRWVECVVILYTNDQGDACEYSLVRWADDKAADLDRLMAELGRDISKQQEDLIALKDQYSLEDTIFRCLGLLTGDETAQNSIESFLETIGGYYDSDRVYILEFDVQHQAVSYSYEWCAGGISPERESLQNLPLSALNFWLQKFREEDVFLLRDIAAQSDENHSYAYQLLRAQGVKSIQAAPLLRGGELVGLVGVDNPRQNEEKLTLLKTVSGFIIEGLEKLRLRSSLDQMNYIDDLTQLHNRRHFARTMEQFTTASPSSLGIITMDINGLKDLNETYGHDFGDRMLRRVARVLATYHRGNVCRIGGDEFAVLCPECSHEGFQQQVLALRGALDELDGCRVSIGFAWSGDQTNLIPTQLQQQADEMRRAEKHAYYLSLLSEGREIKRTGLGGEVLAEIEAGLFEVYYQPQINLRDHSVVGAEALVRKRGEDGSIIPPAKFLPLYEMGGVISYIDLFVMREACLALHDWLAAGHDLHVAVNFSRTTLIKPDIVDIMVKICQDADVPTERIFVEVTENLNKLDSASLRELSDRLVQAGFKISLDDFGSEYSNLAILTAMDFDEVKLDRSLVSSMEENEKGRLVLESVLGLCRGLGRTRSLAEGIETAEQLQLLSSFSCDCGQGYLFSKPISRSAFEEYLQQGSKI